MAIPLHGQIAGGPWEAAFTLRSRLLERHAEATLTFPRAGMTVTVPVVPVDDGWPSLFTAGLLLVLLCSGVLWAVARRRRVNRQR